MTCEKRKLKVLAKVEEKEDTQDIPRYVVLLYNDEKNYMGDVVKWLCEVFNFNPERAFEIMKEAHIKGKAPCGVYPFELAEFKRDKLTTFGLTSTIERV